MHFAVFENVVLVAVKAGARRSVQEVALGPFAHGDDAEIVVEAEAGAQNLVQIGHDLGVDQHVAEGAAMRVGPRERAAEVAAAGDAFERLGAGR